MCLLEEVPTKVIEAKVKLDNKTKKDINLPQISTELQEFTDVFSPEDSKTLFLNSPSNHKIKIKDRTDLSYRPIYSLSQNKLYILYKYLNKNIVLG